MSTPHGQSLEDTRKMLSTLLALPRDHYEEYRNALPRDDLLTLILDTARDANYGLIHTREALRTTQLAKENLNITESRLRATDSRLCGSLEAISGYLQTHLDHLHPQIYHMLASTDPGDVPTIANFFAPAPRAATPYPHVVPPIQNPTVYRHGHRVSTRANAGSTSSRASSRQTRRDRSAAELAYPVIPHVVHNENTPTPSPTRTVSPGFRGPYETFEAMQEARYGRDSDGEVRIFDRYSGEEDYDADRENSPLYQEDVLYNEQDPEV